MKNTRPIVEIIELLGKKWVMRIIWELREEPLTFRALQSACDNISPTVLNSRLKLLESTLIVERRASGGYTLTACGKALLDVYKPLDQWAIAWQKQRQKAL